MDGTKDGYDIDLTKEIVNSVSIPVVASIGCGKRRHDSYFKTDVEAALAASIFHYETHSVNRVKKLIKENGTCEDIVKINKYTVYDNYGAKTSPTLIFQKGMV